MKEQIKKLWNEHERTAFPAGMRGKKVQDIDLTFLESQIATAVFTALETNGILGIRVSREFEASQKQLELVIQELTGEAQTYFQRLQVLAKQLKKWVKPAS